MLFLESVFWFSLFTLVYIYFGYTAIVFFLSKIMRRDVQKGGNKPFVSILIAAHNEEVNIAKTIENKLEMNYPKDRLEIIVVSDDSTDRTDEIVNQYSVENVKLLRQEPRNGKTSALNIGSPESKG